MSLSKTFRKVFEENEWLKRPVKSLISLVVDYVFPFLVFCLAIWLFAPYSRRTTPLNMLWLFLAVLAYNFKKPRALWKRSIWSCMIGAVLLLTSALTPFCFAPKPLYIAIADSGSPFNSTLTFLRTETAIIGSIWILPRTDVARAWMPSLFHRLFPSSIRLIERGHYGQTTYYNVPILDNFTQDSHAKGDVAYKRSIYLPMTVFGKDIRLHLVKPNPFSYTTDQGHYILDFYHLGFESLFYVAYIKYPELIPWNAVEVLDNEKETSLCYTAYLDLGLEAVVAGKPGVALQIFESAVNYVPPKNLEGARLAMLECLIAEETLQGNVGALQSLPYLHKAYDIFGKSTSDPRFSKEDPLTNWIRDTLLRGYGHWNWTTAFYDRDHWLEQLPHVEESEKSYFEELDERLKDRDDNTLLAFAAENERTIPEVYEIRDILLTRVFDRSKKAMYELIGSNDAEKVMAGMASTEKQYIPIIKAINNILRAKGKYDIENVSLAIFDYGATVFPSEFLTTNEQFWRLVDSNANRNQLTAQMAVFFNGLRGRGNLSDIVEGRKGNWWSNEYYLWFGYWSNDALATMMHTKHPWQIDAPQPCGAISNVLKSYGPNCLIMDNNGTGRPFMPGLFWLAWYKEDVVPTESNSWREQFEEETKLKFETVRQSLYRDPIPEGKSHAIDYDD